MVVDLGNQLHCVSERTQRCSRNCANVPIMLRRLSKANRRTSIYACVVAMLFALAPCLSLALSVPIASFSKSVVHAHANEQLHSDHSHVGHELVGTEWHSSHPDDDGHDGNLFSHVHQDASVPSIVLPGFVSAESWPGIGQSLSVPIAQILIGSCPPSLLRPPICLSYV